MARKNIRLQYNAPVTLTFFFLSLASLVLGYLTNNWTTTHLFSVYRSSMTDPLFYVRLFGHVLGHGGWDHFINNMLLFLVVAPPLEERYGSRTLLSGVLMTALVSVRSKLLLPIVCMQTIAANLGSMLTPLGNPQNLYLYGKSGMDMGSFVLLMLPYSVISLVLLAIWAMWLCCGGSSIAVTHSEATSGPDKKLIALYGILFVVCLLVVLRVLPYGVAFAAVLICIFLADHPTLGRVDYSLILTFVACSSLSGIWAVLMHSLGGYRIS